MNSDVLTEVMTRRLFPKHTISQELQDLTDDRYRDLRRPRIVMFYKNGDRYFKGKTLHITPHRYLHYDELLSDLSKSMSLPYGVRRIYTPIGGTLIQDIEDLKDGESYVCASFEKFQRIKYGQHTKQKHLTSCQRAVNKLIELLIPEMKRLEGDTRNILYGDFLPNFSC